MSTCCFQVRPNNRIQRTATLASPRASAAEAHSLAGG